MTESLRPSNLKELIGQPRAVESIANIIGSAKSTGTTARHTLLYGPSGTGKSTCCKIIANELGGKLITSIGASILSVKAMVDLLMQINEGDILFIDEIHGINNLKIVEIAYTAMEDYRLIVPLANGTTRMQIDWPMPPFTLIGATTRLSKVPEPMRRRFPNLITLEYYKDDDLETILTEDAVKLGLVATVDAVKEIAKRGRGTPGAAINLLYNAVDYAHAMGAGILTAEIANAAMDVRGVDKDGLTEKDVEYLRILATRCVDNTAGVLAMASMMGLTDNIGMLTDVIEPWLLRKNFIERTPRGRKLTELGRAHLGLGV